MQAWIVTLRIVLVWRNDLHGQCIWFWGLLKYYFLEKKGRFFCLLVGLFCFVFIARHLTRYLELNPKDLK